MLKYKLQISVSGIGVNCVHYDIIGKFWTFRFLTDLIEGHSIFFNNVDAKLHLKYKKYAFPGKNASNYIMDLKQ